MALQDDLRTIKTELSTQEQMISSFIKTERFVRKYKYYFLALLVIVVLYFSYSYVSGLLNERSLKANNDLYVEILQNPNDEAKLALLKEKNPNLYALFVFSNEGNFTAQLEELKNLDIDPLLKELISADSNPLANEGKFLRYWSDLIKAYDLLKEDKIDEANALLSRIPVDSQLRPLADNFKHYKGKQ